MRRIGRTLLTAGVILVGLGVLAAPATARVGTGLATGEAAEGAARLSLAAKRLTITLARAPAPRARRVTVSANCGDAVVQRPDATFWNVKASGRTRV